MDNYMSWDQYNQMQQQFSSEWYNEWYQQEQERLYQQEQEWLYQQEQERLYREKLDKDFPTITEDNFEKNLTYCSNCEKNFVIDFLTAEYTQCGGCKEILHTDLAVIRQTYSTKSKTNKINNFNNALN